MNYYRLADKIGGWYCENSRLYLCNSFSGAIFDGITLEGPGRADTLAYIAGQRVAQGFEDRLSDGEVRQEMEIEVAELRRLMKDGKRAAKVKRNDLVGVTLGGAWANFDTRIRSGDVQFPYNPDEVLRITEGIKGEVTVTVRYLPNPHQLVAGGWHHLTIRQEGYTGFVIGMAIKDQGKLEIACK